MKNNLEKGSDCEFIRGLVNSAAEIINAQKEAKAKKEAAKKEAKAAQYLKCSKKIYSWKGVIYCKSIDDAVSTYGRKWKVVIENLNKLCKFIVDYAGVWNELLEKEIPQNAIVGLPQTNKDLLALFGTQKNVGKVIKKAVETGLLKVIENSWCPGQISKLYVVNIAKVGEIASLAACRNSGAERSDDEKTHNNNNATYSRTIRFFSAPRSSEELTSLTDGQICSELEQTYPWLTKYYGLNEENNKLVLNAASSGLNNNDINNNATYSRTIRLFETKFTPSVTRNKESNRVTKIGIRAYNQFCSIPKESEICSRYDVLEETFGKGYEEFDVKSSIYRVTYFMNKGVWLDNEIDIYKMMAPYDFTEKFDRDNYKSFAMRLYFGKSGDEVYDKMWKCHIIEKNNENKLAVNKLYNKMREVIGNTLGNEVFLHESCILMRLANKLYKAGFMHYQVYDGFYGETGIKDFCNNNIEQCAAEYYEDVYNCKPTDYCGEPLVYLAEEKENNNEFSEFCRKLVNSAEEKMKNNLNSTTTLHKGPTSLTEADLSL